jgi:hypothetical protein
LRDEADFCAARHRHSGTRDLGFFQQEVLEEGHEHNIPSISRASLEWIEALFCRVAKTRFYPS